MKTKIKTIDVNTKEWFDKINGNSYFSGVVTINFKLKNESTFTMPFQYGYGDHYKTETMNLLIANSYIKDAIKYSNGGTEPLWQYCERKNIILRAIKYENCRKKDLYNI